jgi:hypothetical protein
MCPGASTRRLQATTNLDLSLRAHDPDVCTPPCRHGMEEEANTLAQ